MLNFMTNVRRFSLATSALSAALLSFAAVPAMADDRYTISADGQEVTDNSSHLTWRRCAEGTKWVGTSCIGKPTILSLSDSKAWAASEAATTGKAWRLPVESELVTLVDKTQKKPKIDPMAFPGTPLVPFWCLRPGFTDNLNAYMVSFANGKVSGNEGERKVTMRLVRSN